MENELFSAGDNLRQILVAAESLACFPAGKVGLEGAGSPPKNQTKPKMRDVLFLSHPQRLFFIKGQNKKHDERMATNIIPPEPCGSLSFDLLDGYWQVRGAINF